MFLFLRTLYTKYKINTCWYKPKSKNTARCNRRPLTLEGACCGGETTAPEEGELLTHRPRGAAGAGSQVVHAMSQLEEKLASLGPTHGRLPHPSYSHLHSNKQRCGPSLAGQFRSTRLRGNLHIWSGDPSGVHRRRGAHTPPVVTQAGSTGGRLLSRSRAAGGLGGKHTPQESRGLSPHLALCSRAGCVTLGE